MNCPKCQGTAWVRTDVERGHYCMACSYTPKTEAMKVAAEQRCKLSERTPPPLVKRKRKKKKKNPQPPGAAARRTGYGRGKLKP